MGTYNIHAGHCPQGQGANGAAGLLQESVEDRKVKDRVISALRKAGHTVYDCTDDSNCDVGTNLRRIVDKCNAHAVDLDVSIHLNAGGGTGVEVWCYSNKVSDIASVICDNISNVLGIRIRGVKYSNRLYVLKNTKAPALLVECCFVDNQNDYDHWNAEKCGDAIASAIVGKKVQGSGGTVLSPKPAAPAVKPNAAFDFEGWVRRLQAECNKQGFSDQPVDGAPGPKTLAGCPTLKRGCSGNITKLLQERLNSLGYHCGVDGDYGKAPFHETYDTIKAYQKAKGLGVDGIVGPKTWSKLLGLS